VPPEYDNKEEDDKKGVDVDPNEYGGLGLTRKQFFDKMTPTINEIHYKDQDK
jgi:hypothetical protein